jgi:hypothetical protein
VVASKQILQGITPSIVEALSTAEMEADDYLENCMWVILKAQDKTITPEWVSENAESRDQLMDIILYQCYLHHTMDRLGESLVGRLQKLAAMMGLKIDSDGLKQLWKRVSDDFSAKISSLSSIVPNAIGQFTENASETTTRSLPNLVESVSGAGQVSDNPEFHEVIR